MKIDKRLIEVCLQARRPHTFGFLLQRRRTFVFFSTCLIVVHTSGAGWAAAMPKEVLHQDIDPGLNLKFKAQWGPGCSA